MPNKDIISANRREKLAIWLCVASFVVGTFLVVFGLIAPPPGEIHNSVLIACGEFLTFTGAILGLQVIIKKNVKDELKELKQQIMDSLQNDEES